MGFQTHASLPKRVTALRTFSVAAGGRGAAGVCQATGGPERANENDPRCCIATLIVPMESGRGGGDPAPPRVLPLRRSAGAVGESLWLFSRTMRGAAPFSAARASVNTRPGAYDRERPCGHLDDYVDRDTERTPRRSRSTSRRRRAAGEDIHLELNQTPSLSMPRSARQLGVHAVHRRVVDEGELEVDPSDEIVDLTPRAGWRARRKSCS